jgi:gamma-glutamyltranspeptidase
VDGGFALVFYDRANLWEIPDLQPSVERLVSRGYALALAGACRRPTVSLLSVAPPHEERTRRISIGGRQGRVGGGTDANHQRAVGSGPVVPGTGVLLNNVDGRFLRRRAELVSAVGNELNAPAPGKRPLPA